MTSQPFSRRVAVYFGTLFLMAMAAMAVLWYFGLPWGDLAGAKDQRLSEAMHLLELSADQRRAEINRSIEERRGDILVVAENKLVSGLLARHHADAQHEVERIFARLQRAYPDAYLGLDVVDPVSKKILASSDADLVGQLFADPELVTRATQPGVTEMVEHVAGKNAQVPAIVRQMHAPDGVGYPNGKLAGILVAYLDTTRLIGFDLAMERQGGGFSGAYFLFDSAGKMLSASSLNAQAEAVFKKDERIGSGFEGTLIVSAGNEGEFIAVYRHLQFSEAQGWTLVSYQSKADALRGLKRHTEALLIAGVLLIITALFSVGFLARRLTRPIRQLTAVARQFGQGDLSVRATADQLSDREMQELSEAFNGMADSVGAAQTELAARVDRRTEELARERDAAQRYLDIAGVMLLALDADGRIAMINRKGAQILGLPVGELLGMEWFEHFPLPEQRTEIRRVFAELMADKVDAPGYYENCIVTVSGQVLFVAWNNVVLRNAEGKPIGTLSSGEDISERKRAEDALHRLAQDLEHRVESRTRELATANAALTGTLDTLRQTQDELIQREKLASLGALVAGVAHELNTPLGNSVTVSTTMRDELAAFSREFAMNALTRSRLANFIEMSSHGLVLLSRNLERANDMVANFKKMATDQSTEKRREFDLAQTVDEIIEVLAPQFKKTPHRVFADLPAGVLMDSFPGPFGQVVTNLILNSLVHGFFDEMSGEVRISLDRLADDRVRLLFADNGRGIPPEHLSRVFDPFFTTRFGQGGSGLGLHIVFNIVTSTLGGTVQVKSAPGEGTVFVIELPRVAPR